MAAVFRNEVSSATAPKSTMLKVSAGKDVLRIDCSISAAIFHLSPSVAGKLDSDKEDENNGKRRIIAFQ